MCTRFLCHPPPHYLASLYQEQQGGNTKGREELAKEKEEVRLVRHLGRSQPTYTLLYILLLAVNSTDLHKETNAPSVARLFTRWQQSRETRHTERTSDAFQLERLAEPLRRSREFSPASEASRAEAVCLVSWTKRRISGTRTMRNLNVTADRMGEAWVGPENRSNS